jgi:hypothetical protein
MDACLCPECMEPAAAVGSVMTSADLMAALAEHAVEEELAFEPSPGEGECLVYTLVCDRCGEPSLHETERLSSLGEATA